MSYYIYLLHHENKNRTYLGITNNIRRRWRQHNGEIKGGAKATTALLGYGKWIVISAFNSSKLFGICISRITLILNGYASDVSTNAHNAKI